MEAPLLPVNGGAAPSSSTAVATVAAGSPPPLRNPSKHARLQALDLVRGFTVWLMIFVDEVGGAYNRGINHSPWDNFTLADFVMPWFLFMVGAAMAFSLRKYTPSSERSAATCGEGLRKVVVRAVKLFVLGVLMQGGGWPGDASDFTFGYNLRTIRPCGILQRIAIAYLIVGCIEILAKPTPRIARWLVPASAEESPRTRCRCAALLPFREHLALFTDYSVQWIAGFASLLFYLIVVYAVAVPDWSVEIGEAVDRGLNGSALVVHCGGVRGAIHSPQCWAGGYVDRLILTQHHVYHPAEKVRLPECSSCSPADCPRAVRPIWCDAPAYDPEGILATVPTVLSTVIGLHFGRAVKGLVTTKSRVAHWSIFSTLLIALGGVIHFSGDPINKQRWSPSYVFFMAGTCGAALTVVYLLIDVLLPSPRMAKIGGAKLALPLFPFVAMGMNAILFFFFHGTAETLINSVYVPTTDKTLCGDEGKCTLLPWIERTWFAEFDNDVGFYHDSPRVLAYTLCKLTFGYLFAAWLLWKLNVFWKI